MSNWKLFVGVALVFIFGVLFGLLPGFYFTHRFPLHPTALDGPFAQGCNDDRETLEGP